MATNTRQARREAERKRREYEENYLDRLKIQFHNSVIVEGAEDLPKRYLLNVLLGKGAIAYDKATQLYLPFVQAGIDVYGLPKQYNLIGHNGFNIWREPEDVVILRANDLQYPLERYFEQQVKKIVDYDLAIEQNLEAVKTMTVAEVPDQATLLSIANEMEARRIGATVIFKNAAASVGQEVKVQSTGAQYLVDKMLDARKEILNETLSTIGISVSNTDKKERVQGMEVLASQGYAVDCISALIDTFNYDAEWGNLPIRLRANTSLMLDREMQQEQEQEQEKEVKNEYI